MNVSCCLADDVFVFHCDLACVFASDRVGSPMPSDTRAKTRALWPALTINTVAQKAFGGQGCLEQSQISEAHPEPEFINEFRNKLRQRRWIVPHTVCFFNHIPLYCSY